MGTTESFFAPLNPEGQSINLDAANKMLQELRDAYDGKYTDVFNAKVLIGEAENLCRELSGLKGLGPEVGQTIDELNKAIDHLNDAMKQVH